MGFPPATIKLVSCGWVPATLSTTLSSFPPSHCLLSSFPILVHVAQALGKSLKSPLLSIPSCNQQPGPKASS